MTVEERVEILISKIVTVRSNPHYRMGDVIYRKGLRYKDSAEQVLALPEFDGTILKSYLLATDDVETPNIPLLWDLVCQAASFGKFALPSNDELVLHIRAGDVVEKNWFLTTDFLGKVGRYEAARRCSVVTCFSFQEFAEKGWWLFSEEKLQKNISMVTDLFRSLIVKYPDLHYDVVSNSEVDKDFVYMVNAPYFIPDRGGFTKLVNDVRNYRLGKNPNGAPAVSG